MKEKIQKKQLSQQQKSLYFNRLAILFIQLQDAYEKNKNYTLIRNKIYKLIEEIYERP